mgnify:CR=1 FL=1
MTDFYSRGPVLGGPSRYHYSSGAEVAAAMPQADTAYKEQQKRTRWAKIASTVSLAVLFAAVAYQTPHKHLVSSFLALLNCVVAVLVTTRFIRRLGIEAILPALFLGTTVLIWSITSIYFAAAVPNSYYTTMHGSRTHLHNAVWMQLATLAFIGTYSGVVWLFLGHDSKSWSSWNFYQLGRPMGLLALFLAITYLVLHSSSRIIAFPGIFIYVLDAAFGYLLGVFFLIGALITYIRIVGKVTLALAVLFAGAIYTLGNARGMFVFPLAFLFIGLFFLSRLSTFWKLMLLGLCLIAFPVYMVVGNIVRSETGVGGFDSMQRNVALLWDWRHFLSEGSPLFSAMGRLFPTGGHAIVGYTPSSYDYLTFDLIGYLKELLVRIFVPGTFYFRPVYSYNGMLGRLGLNIYTSSVGVTQIGSLWILGGFLPLVLGTAFTGLIHGIAISMVHRARRVHPAKGLFLLCMVAPVFVKGPLFTQISHIRALIWTWLVAAVLYHMFVRWIAVGRPAPQPT